MKTARLIFLLPLALAAAPLHAQRAKSIVPDLDAEGKPGEIARAQFRKSVEKFDRIDENKDGAIDRAEADKQFSEYEKGGFDGRDKNKDGKLSWEEFLGHDRWKKDALK